MTAESHGDAGLFHSLSVGRVILETPDTRSLVLEVPEDLRETFRYKAGQFLTFRVTLADETLVRCYSLASSPVADSECKVTVKRVDEGRVSNWMNDSLNAGDSLEVMRPAGLFCLRDRDTPLILFAGGSGITPVISIIKTALVTTQRPIRLLYANRDRASVIFHDELDALVAQHPDRFALKHRLDVEDGFADAAWVRAQVGEATVADFYICGPGPFMDIVEAALQGLGVATDQIFIERFEYEADADGQDVGALSGAEGEETPETLSVELEGHVHEVPYQAGETILDAVRRAGFEPPFACEEGYCGCCMATLSEGSVHMKANDCLDESEIAEGHILTCQSVPRTRAIKVAYPD